MKSNYELLRKLVITSLEDDSVLEMEDDAYRWYSKTFFTPLAEAYKIPAQIVVYYKWKESLTGIERAQLEEQKQLFVKPNWKIMLQDPSGAEQDNLEMDDEAWIAEEEAKIKAQEMTKNGMTDQDIMKQVHDAIGLLSTKMAVLNESAPKENKEE